MAGRKYVRIGPDNWELFQEIIKKQNYLWRFGDPNPDQLKCIKSGLFLIFKRDYWYEEKGINWITFGFPESLGELDAGGYAHTLLSFEEFFGIPEVEDDTIIRYQNKLRSVRNSNKRRALQLKINKLRRQLKG
jgi:hypothetical protein